MTIAKLESNADYIRLLLTSDSRNQVIALLDTATKEQISALSEIFHNITRLPIAPETKVGINARQKLLEKLSDKKTTTRQKGQLLSRHQRIIIDILHSVRGSLLSLLK